MSRHSQDAYFSNSSSVCHHLNLLAVAFGCEVGGDVSSEVKCFSVQLLQFEKKGEHSAFLHKEKKCKAAELSQPQATIEPGPSAPVVFTQVREIHMNSDGSSSEVNWRQSVAKGIKYFGLVQRPNDSGLKVSFFCEWRGFHSQAIK